MRKGQLIITNAELDWHDGTLNVRRWAPVEPKFAGTFLFLHGMESHAEWFDVIASALASLGFEAFAYDRSGWGKSSGRRGDLASREAALQEFAHVLASTFSPAAKPHLVGLSWGGLFAVHAARRYAAQLGSLTLISPALVPARRLGIWRIFGVLFGGVPLPIEVGDFTSDAAALRFIANDPARVTQVSGRFLLTTRKWLKTLPAALSGLPRELPKSLALAGRDALIDVEATRRLAVNSGFSVQEYPEKNHSLIFDAPEVLAAQLAGLATKGGKDFGA